MRPSGQWTTPAGPCGPAGSATMSLTVGPIGWTISAEPMLGAVVDRLLDGVTPVVTPHRDSAARFALHVSLTVAPELSGRRERPRLPWFSREGEALEALIDRSQGWDARLDLEDTGVRADFALVDVAGFGADWAPTLMALNVAAALRVSLGMAAPRAGALLFHAAALTHPTHGAALFLGASGEGKTTMSRRLPGWHLLSDDAALVWRTPSGWFVVGTPLPGKEALPRSLTPAPLSALVVLAANAPELSLTALDHGDSGFQLMSRLLWFGEPTETLATLIAELTTSVRAFRLSSNLEHEVAPLLAAVLEGVA